MSNNQEKMRYIVHLSDIHLKTVDQGQIYRERLMLDLTDNLKIRKIHHLVISGDLTNTSTLAEYDAAFELLNELKIKFNISSDRMIIAPGNHDLSWDISGQSYSYVPKHQLPANLGDEYVRLSEGDALRRDEDKYRRRFDNFSAFYKRICGGETYTAVYEDQAIIHPFPENRILFLVLNSAWQIDNRFTERAGINMSALGKALGKIEPAKYDGWLKVAVWHHPVSGKEAMNAEFLEQLAVKGFEICMHGHVHEAIEGYHNYDSQRGLHIIGGGTFGAPAKEQVTGIPLQYNLIGFDLEKGTLTVRSRKKEKVDGAWSADSRWGDKETPVPYYNITLSKYQAPNPRVSYLTGEGTDLMSPADVPVQAPSPTAYVDLMGTRWSADWHHEDGTIYVSDKVTFERLTGNNQFEGYGEVTHHGKEYKYSIRGEVSRTGIVVFIYKAERFPTEANIGTACLQLSISAEQLEGAWIGFGSVKQPDGKKVATIINGNLSMQKIKEFKT